MVKKRLIKHAFSALKEGNLFMKAHVAFGTVAWNDEIDLSPDTVYLSGKKNADDDQAVQKTAVNPT